MSGKFMGPPTFFFFCIFLHNMHNYQNTDKIIPEKNPDNPKIYWRRLPIWRFFWYYVQATILDIFLNVFTKPMQTLQVICILWLRVSFVHHHHHHPPSPETV